MEAGGVHAAVVPSALSHVPARVRARGATSHPVVVVVLCYPFPVVPVHDTRALVQYSIQIGVTVAALLVRAPVGRSPDLEEVGALENDDFECSRETAVVVKKTPRGLAEGGKLATDQRDLAKHVRLAEWSRRDLKAQC